MSFALHLLLQYLATPQERQITVAEGLPQRQHSENLGISSAIYYSYIVCRLISTNLTNDNKITIQTASDLPSSMKLVFQEIPTENASNLAQCTVLSFKRENIISFCLL
jgi:hypothetical protein